MPQLSMPGVFNIRTSYSKELLDYLPSYSFVKCFISNSLLLQFKQIPAYRFNAWMPAEITIEFSLTSVKPVYGASTKRRKVN
jgi:hypothetical protein